MSLSYKKLWKQLIDRDMTKTDLRRATGISPSTFARLSHGDYVASSVIDVLDGKSHGTKMSNKKQRRSAK